MRQIKIEKLLTLRDSRGVELYLQDIEKLPMISAEEEIELSKLIQQGDEIALEKLIKANLRFVISVAKKYQNVGAPLLDLINEGNIGLIVAAKRFDHSMGFKFISYAVWWIRQHIMTYLNEKLKTIRLPNNKSGIYFKIKKAQETFEQRYEREPTNEELKDILQDHKDISLNSISESFQFNKRTLSLDKPLSDDSDASLVDFVENTEGNYVLDSMELDSVKGKIEMLLSQLTPTERYIITRFYGINEASTSLESIGESLCLTRERIRQIKEKALRKLKYTAIKHPKELEMA